MKISRQVLITLLGIIAGLTGIPADLMLELTIFILVNIFGFAITDGLNPKMMDLPEKWKSTRLWTSVVTVAAIVISNLTGIGEPIIVPLLRAAIAIVVGITITDTLAVRSMKKR